MKQQNIDYEVLKHFLPHKYSFAQKVRGDMIIKSLRKGKLLDIGTGCGWLARLAQEKGFKVFGVDSADKVIEENRWFDKLTSKPIIIKKASIYSLPFKEKSFDSVAIVEVLEHLSSPKKALKEARRVMRDNGKFVLLIPGYTYMFIYDEVAHPLSNFSLFSYDKRISRKFARVGLSHKRQYEDAHRFSYNLKSLKELLASSGFKIEKVVNTEFLSPFINTILCNLLKIPREKITFVEKLDTMAMKLVPLWLGSDWMFVCKKA